MGTSTAAHVKVPAVEFSVETGSPSTCIVYQIVGPSSVEAHLREACVGPTSSNCTSGLVGAASSPGSVTVTALLDLDRFPAASLA